MSALPSPQEAVESGPAESGGGVLGVASDPKQLDLLRNPDGKLPTNVFTLVRQEPELARGPGRPKGAKNKRSAGLSELIKHKYGCPVEFQASIYHMPLDQLCELILVADGTIERREKLDALLTDMGQRVRELAAIEKATGNSDGKSIERLAEACEALESVARTSAGKPGDVALKAMNLQLAASRTVSEYTDSKKPAEVKVEFDAIPTIVMPGGGAGSDFNRQDAETRLAGDLLAKALKQGRIEAQDIVGLEFRDGQFVVDGEFVEVSDTNPPEDGDDG